MQRFEVRGRYLDEYKLVALCKKLFGKDDEGKNNFAIEFEEDSDMWIMELPRELTEQEVTACSI